MPQITVKQRVSSILSIDELQLELEATPVPGTVPIVAQPSDDTIVVGYLVFDTDCPNPLEVVDGQGSIFTSSRRNRNYDPSAIREALGLNSDDEPDYELLDDDAVQAKYADFFVAHVAPEDLYPFWEKKEGQSDQEYLTSCAELDYKNAAMDRVLFQKQLDAIRHQLWTNEINSGQIGNPYAVPVNNVGHQGSAKYVVETSITGNAAWIPDSFAIDNIEYLSIQSLLPEGTKVEYLSTDAKPNDVTFILPNGDKQGGFDSFNEAIRAAANKLGVAVSDEQVIESGRRIASEYANNICEEYNNWLNGENYGFFVESFYREDEETWLSDAFDSSFGFIGGDYAKKSLQEAFDAQVIASASHATGEAEETGMHI